MSYDQAQADCFTKNGGLLTLSSPVESLKVKVKVRNGEHFIGKVNEIIF